MKGRTILNFCAYISVALIAVALLLAQVFGWLISAKFTSVLMLIAQIIAYTLAAIYAFIFAKSKKKIGWMVAYCIFVVIIIVFMILAYV